MERVAILLLTGVLAAGCATTDDPTEASPQNRAPTAALNASIAQGEVPLQVTFDIDGADPDGGALSWRLDPGDGTAAVTGDEFPADHVHMYRTEGEWTATLTVSDGSEEGETSVMLHATPGEKGRARADHGYDPHYPALCLREDETTPGDDGEGSYSCEGAVYLDCLGGPEPCMTCEGYHYRYSRDQTPPEEETYTGCIPP